MNTRCRRGFVIPPGATDNADTEVADLVARPKIVSVRAIGLMLGYAVLGAVSEKPYVTHAIAFRWQK